MNLRCMIAGHAWCRWEPFAPNVCREVRVCLREGSAQFRTVPHVWTASQYRPGEGHCIETRSCQRCGETMSSPSRHEIGPEEYLDDKSCVLRHSCRHCGHASVGYAEKHQWKVQYAKDGECLKIQVCERCEEEEVLAVEHDLFPPKRTCKDDSVCKRCGSTEKGYHQYVPIGRVKATDTYCRERCKHCGDIQTEYFDRPEEPCEHGYFGP